MKIVHCSDLHLGKRFSGNKDYVKKRYMDFFNAFAVFVDRVEEIKPDVCLIAGDIFDKKEINPDILSKAEYLFKRLRDNVKKNIIAIEGNHDNSRILEESWLEYLQEQNILKVFYLNVNLNNVLFSLYPPTIVSKFTKPTDILIIWNFRKFLIQNILNCFIYIF